MSSLGEITQKFYNTTRLFGKPMHHALGSLSYIFEGSRREAGEGDELTRHVLTLFSAVIWANGRVQDEELGEVRGFFAENYPERRIDDFIDRIKHRQVTETMEAAAKLAVLPD